MGFRWLSNHSQVDCGLHDHFATIVAHLLPSCITAVAFVFSLFTFPLSMRLYNNAAKIFGAERVLRRRLENLEGKMVYTTRGKCSVYYASRVSVFFLKKVSSREDCAEGTIGSLRATQSLREHCSTSMAYLYPICGRNLLGCSDTTPLLH